MAAAVLLGGCVGESGEATDPQPTITQPSMAIQPIDPGESLPTTTDIPSPTEPPATSLEGISAATVNRLFGPVCHTLNDGGMPEVHNFDASTRQEDDFYTGVVYFYFCAIEGQDDKDINLEIADSVYRVSADDLQKLFTSYFGNDFAGEVEKIFAGNLVADGSYEFLMSDGPSYTASLVSGGGEMDTATIEVQAMQDGYDGVVPAGTFKATLRKDDASIFGYSIQSYAYTPAE